MNEQILIRRAFTDDYRIIAGLGAATFYETWRPVNTEEDMQKYIAKAFDETHIKDDLEDNLTNTFFLAVIGGEPAGYAKLRRDRTYDEFNNQKAIELERIYVYSRWQRTGVGKQLMDKCIALALEEKYDWFWLGVNIENLKAISFYRKYGFTIFGEKAFQLGNAVDNDFLMKLKLHA
jgi:ribosomal protein S18 acetylase RimI-like enzyme